MLATTTTTDKRHATTGRSLILIILALAHVVVSRKNAEVQEVLADVQRANLNARTRTIQDTVALTHFAAVRPNKPAYGGFGNLLWTFVEVQGIALATNKRAVFNHAVINSLFNHPDVAGNQSFDLLSHEAVTTMYENPEERAVVRYLYPCKLAITRPFSTYARRVYIHGASVARCASNAPGFLPSPAPPPAQAALGKTS